MEENNRKYIAYAYAGTSSKPTVLYEDDIKIILDKLSSYNDARMEHNRFYACDIGEIVPDGKTYSHFRRVDMDGKDLGYRYLNLPAQGKEEFRKTTEYLKNNGAKFNATIKKWYITPDIAPINFEKYLVSAPEEDVLKYETPLSQLPTPDIRQEYVVNFPGVKEVRIQMTGKESGEEIIQKIEDAAKDILHEKNILSSEQNQGNYKLSEASELLDSKETVKIEEYAANDYAPIMDTVQQSEPVINETGFSPEQEAVLTRAKADQLTPEEYNLVANHKLSSAQMEEIRWSIKDGISIQDVQAYAMPDCPVIHMSAYRIGLQHGVSMEKMAEIVSKSKEWDVLRNATDSAIKEVREHIISSYEKNGFKLDKNLVKKIEEVNFRTRTFNKPKDMCDRFRALPKDNRSSVDNLVKEIGQELRTQELSRKIVQCAAP